MPIYEYKCDRCGEVFEVRQKFADEPVTVHETCGGAVQRLMSAPSFQFKGSGWYATDYGKGGNGSKKDDKEKSDKEKSDKEKSDKESKPSTDTKSETKSGGESKSGSESKSSTESKPASTDKSKTE